MSVQRSRLARGESRHCLRNECIVSSFGDQLASMSLVLACLRLAQENVLRDILKKVAELCGPTSALGRAEGSAPVPCLLVKAGVLDASGDADMRARRAVH
eukprot:7934357-Heterocapsa_arctica.AAC.1